MKHKTKLTSSFQNKKNYSDNLSKKLKSNIEKIASASKSRKGVFTVLTTLLTHKIIFPAQDIRCHRKDIKNGFPGRSIDTNEITPTLKKLGLPSMAESGWLTRSLEQPAPYNLDYAGKISENVKNPFLEILHEVEENNADSKMILSHLLFKTHETALENQVPITPLEEGEDIVMDDIIEFLREQFNYQYQTPGGSKLPVIALHSIISIVVQENKRYIGYILEPLGSHTASDKTSKSTGDIEISKKGQIFEAIEVKHNKSIDPNMVRVAQEKIYKHNPQRYYILSDADIKEVEECISLVKETKEKHGCEITLNGVLKTIKYYLRLVKNPKDFIQVYLQAIEKDDELKKVHKDTCNELVKKHLKMEG